MDENDNRWEMPPTQPPKKTNPFKDWRFYATYFITIAILFIISFLLVRGETYLLISLFILSIPYALIGLVVSAIVRMNNNKSVASGILLGSITPFIVVFISTGGCGLIYFL